MQTVPSSLSKSPGQTNRQFIDISVSIHDSMLTWPGLPRVDVHKFRDLYKGDEKNITHISFCAHTGTHIDAPRHLEKKGPTISDMPLEVTNGPAKVIQIKDHYSIKLEELEQYSIRSGDRIIFKTLNSENDYTTQSFKEDFVDLTPSAAEYLAYKQVKCVGIDYLSIASRSVGKVVKQKLLEAGVWIINGLDLKNAEPGQYMLCCLPLKLECADGAPARAILITQE